ncbi:MAG: hypothetical protein ACM3PE_12070 [Deltaproteobacteria bacterium]
MLVGDWGISIRNRCSGRSQSRCKTAVSAANRFNGQGSAWILVMGYLGAVIGAGFASGQEIVQFFVVYGDRGGQGAILAMLLFIACGGLLLHLAHREGISNYQELLFYLMGPRLGRAVDFALAIFLFLGISTMLSASGAVFYEHLYLPKNAGIITAYILVVLLLATGKKGLIMSYNLLVPAKVILLSGISAWAVFMVKTQPLPAAAMINCPADPRFWLLSSVLYVAYNFALAMVVLTEYQPVTGRSAGIRGAMGGGIILGLLVVLNYLALAKFLPAVFHYQVPMLYVAGNISITAKHIYTLVLWMGILTTAIANAYGFAQRFSDLTGLAYGPCLALCMTLALPVSSQSFSGLVGRIYPLFGILGVVIIVALIVKVFGGLLQK